MLHMCTSATTRREVWRTTVGETTRSSSAFNKLLALLHDEHLNCLKAVRDEFQCVPSSHELAGSRDPNTSKINICSTDASDTTYNVSITETVFSDGSGFDDFDNGIPVEPNAHYQPRQVNPALQRDTSLELPCVLSRSEHSIAPQKHETSETMPMLSEFQQRYELRREWESMTVSSRTTGVSRVSRKSVTAYTFSDMLEPTLSETHYSKFDTKCTRRLIIHPNSKRLLGWDLLGFFLIAYEMVVLPLMAFEMGDSVFLTAAEWTGRFFWTFDIMVSTMRGFFKQGRLFMSFPKAVRRYLCSWFALDISLVIIDWVLMIVDSQANGNEDHSLGVVRALRVTRLARMLRILRVLKLKRLFSAISDFISTDVLMVYFKITKPVFSILFLIHWIACGWYGIGALVEEYGGAPDWLTASDSQQRSQGYLYCTSLHWSLSQFVLGSIDVHAQNIYERLYTICALLVGVVAFSTLIGGFTSAVEEIREIKSEKTKQFSLLRRFLRDYRISQILTSRIQKHCAYTYEHRKSRLQENDVKLLELISEQLKQELSKEMYTPELTPHPLFSRMALHRCVCLDRICRLALIPRSYAQGDLIFASGADPFGLIILTDGQCNYVQRTIAGSKQITKVFKEQWICEPVLWTRNWLTLGKAKAVAQCRAVSVDSSGFKIVFSEADPKDWDLVHKYAGEFVRMLNCLSESDISDLLPADVLQCCQCHEERKLSEGVPSFSHAVMSKVMWPGPRIVVSDHSENALARVVARLSPRILNRLPTFRMTKEYSSSPPGKNLLRNTDFEAGTPKSQTTNQSLEVVLPSTSMTAPEFKKVASL